MKPKILTLDDDSDDDDSNNSDDVYNFGPEDMDEDDEYRSATTYCLAWFQSATVFKEAISHIGDLFHDEGKVWKITDVVVEPPRSQALYFRYYERGQDSEGKEIRQPPDSRSMYFESSASLNISSSWALVLNSFLAFALAALSFLIFSLVR